MRKCTRSHAPVADRGPAWYADGTWSRIITRPPLTPPPLSRFHTVAPHHTSDLSDRRRTPGRSPIAAPRANGLRLAPDARDDSGAERCLGAAISVALAAIRRRAVAHPALPVCATRRQN